MAASPFYGTGDRVNAVVADLGAYATKIGWAGSDFPVSYFRSDIAVLREQNNNEKDDAMEVEGEETKTKSPQSVFHRHRKPIVDIRYDYHHRPIQFAETGGGDGPWGEVSNPVNSTTGLWYDKNNNNRDDTDTSPKEEEDEEEEDSPAKSNSNNHQSQNANSANNDDGDGADWYDLMHQLIRHGYETGLTTKEVDQHPLLLVERSYNPPPIRQQTLECLFEELQVPAAFLAKDAVLSCYASGRVTGTVVDMGYNGTTVTPVYDGYVESKGIQYCPVGVRSQDDLILEYMDQLYAQKHAKSKKTPANSQGVMPLYQVRRGADFKPTPFARRSRDFHRVARLALAQECREAGACAAVDTTASSSGGGVAYNAPHKAFSLPDGTTVLDIPSQYRFATAEFILGDPATAAAASSSSISENTPSTSSLLSSKTSSATMAQRRQTVTEERRKQLSDIIAKVTAAAEAAETDNKEDDTAGATNLLSGSGGGDGDEFTEATAVGISKRRTTQQQRRGGGGGTTTTGTTGTTSTASKQQQQQQQQQQQLQRPPFSNARLQKACLNYLQVHLDAHITSAPIANMICDAAYKCDRDQQGALLGNVVLAGGGSCMGPTEQAVPDKIREQVEGLIHAHTPGWRVKMHAASSFAERSVLPWMGGSILASLGTFHDMWITKSEYEEWGTAIVNRKCP